MTVGSGSSAKILRFSYDASGNAVAVDYSTDNGSTFNTYYYLRNAQNDIVKLIDNSCSGFVNEFDDSSPGSTKDISTNIALHFVFEVCRIKVFQSILDILDDRWC